ncbi:hypothetical protein EC912_10141 [Luteibacter rhizovicinus]|uniref:Ricin-type beta-trefoil lectin protein n=1 Tax=Luteibacter rhizovicinus TaxID=242606 RepID=A0A4R3YVJ2_9GAMM|nr:hypothetical protein [Luteibacter rhizovicinus]TCV97047.1 hypothetical protein EC912_10141 [Luteibacter rhizovicinus]
MNYTRRGAYALATLAGLCMAASTATAANRMYGPLLLVDQRAGKSIYYAFERSSVRWIAPMRNPDKTGAEEYDWPFDGGRFPAAGNLRNTIFVTIPGDRETGPVVDTLGRCLTSNDTYQNVRFEVCASGKAEQTWTIVGGHMYRAQGRTNSASLAFDPNLSGSNNLFLSPTPIMRLYIETFVDDEPPVEES